MLSIRRARGRGSNRVAKAHPSIECHVQACRLAIGHADAMQHRLQLAHAAVGLQRTAVRLHASWACSTADHLAALCLHSLDICD